jgi:O-antigen/teichoic acid export membrane protein
MNASRILKSILVLASSQVASWLLSIGYLVILGRYLGPTRLGELTYAVSVGSPLVLITQLGMTALVTRNVAREPEQAGSILGTAMVARLGLSVVVPIALACYAYVAHFNAETTTVAFVAITGIIVNGFTVLLQAAWQGREEMGLLAIGQIGEKALQFTLVGVVMVFHGGVPAVAGGGALTMGLMLAWNLYLARRIMALTFRIRWAAVRDMIVRSLSFWANGLFETFYGYIDSIILASIAGARAVGFYSPPLRFYSLALFVPTILGYATTPLLSRLGVERGNNFAEVGRKMLSLFIIAAVPLTVGIMFAARPLITIIFGPQYGPSVPVLVAVSACILPTYLNVGFYQILAASDSQGLWTPIMAVGCIVNPLGNILLIRFAQHQWHNPTIGAAIALALTEALMTVYGAFILRRVVICPAMGRAVRGTVVAGGAQAAILLVAGDRSLVVLVVAEVLAGGAYAALTYLLKSLPYGDFETLWAMMRRRVPTVT